MTRTLKDYRPQHDEDCASRECTRCKFRRVNVRHVSGNGGHPFTPKPCTCGLDTLLSEPRSGEGATPQEQERPWNWGDWRPCAEHPKADHELVCFECNPALAGEGATPLKDGNDGNTQQGNAGALEGAERQTGVAGDARQPEVSRARSVVAGWSHDHHSQTVGEDATPPQAEPGDEIARAREAVMVAAHNIWKDATQASGWSQLDEAVDALIAAVRQGHAPRR